MKTSELAPGTVLKFKTHTRLSVFYDTDMYGHMIPIDICPGTIVTLIKTSKKDHHVGQTLLINGSYIVVYYLADTWFDKNEGAIKDLVMAREYYYDII